MFPEYFTEIEFYQKKKDIIIYHAKDSVCNYILKAIISEDSSMKQAFYDEYSVLRLLNHPMVPRYYGLKESCSLEVPSVGGCPSLVLCMEYCKGQPLSQMHHLSYENLRFLLTSMGKLLLYLLQQGILYTDLNPSNILMEEKEGTFEIHLLDYTFCYYYKVDPQPPYPIRFSYDLSPNLKGQQLLIQELAQLAAHLLDQLEVDQIPSEFYVWMETGLHPTEDLFLPDYIHML